MAPVFLGVMMASADEAKRYQEARTLDFVAIPDGYGFHQKYHVVHFASFPILDKTEKWPLS